MSQRSRAIALALLAASLLALLWVIATKPVLGVAGQHHYPYHPAPRLTALLLLVLLALPVLGGMVVLMRGRAPMTPRRAWLLVALFTVGALALRGGTALAPKRLPGAEVAWPFLWQNTEGAYATKVPAARNVARFLGSYAGRLDVSTDPSSVRYVRIHHADVHPPGIVLGFTLIEALYDAAPGLARAAERRTASLFPSLAVFRNVTSWPIRHALPVAMTLAFGIIVLASLAPLLAFLATRRIWPAEAALAAAGLAALVPGTYLFNPSIDQAYPTLTLLLCWLAAGLITTRKVRWGVALGVAFYAAMFLHVGYGLAGAILALAALLAWRAERPEWMLRELAAAYWRPLVGAAAAFLALALAMRLAFGYETFRVIGLCLRNNARFNAMMGRTWWPWVAVVPFEFALSFGFALALLVAGGWLLEAAGAVRARALRARSALLLAAGGVLLLLHVCGMNRGETARLWLFLTPLLVLGAVDFLRRRTDRPRGLLAAVAAAQAIQIVLFAVFLDLGRTANFFLKDLPEAVGR